MWWLQVGEKEARSTVNSCGVMLQVRSFIGREKILPARCINSETQSRSTVFSFPQYLLVRHLPLEGTLFHNCTVTVLLPFSEEENFIRMVNFSR